MYALATLVALLLAGSLVYCVLIVIAARAYLAQRRVSTNGREPISVLKPLSGAEAHLEANLRSFFDQDHPDFELIFAVRTAEDAAADVVRRLQDEFPNRSAQLVVTGEPPYANPKVFSLDRMLALARHDLLVMSDSDIRIPAGFLKAIAAEFEDRDLGLATCPYRAVGGPSIWSTLEAQGMNTDFLGGLLVARMIGGVRFAVGPTVAARRSVLQAIGGLPSLKDYLAEDFVMGKFAAAGGLGVIISQNVVEHHIGSEDLGVNATHRLRWSRSTRRSRPLGYLGQLFTYPLPLALILWCLHPAWWPALLPVMALRALAAWATCRWVLGSRPSWLLLPMQDILSFFFYVAGYFGNTIEWRGRRYYLHRDGRFELR